LLLSQKNLRLEFGGLVLYYFFARRGVYPMAPDLRTPACQFHLSHSDDKHSY
jgi:hypothetical protein